ncbi:hypothetical protein [Paenibacillus sp.]|uniref:hypothetical protein n=1 Tax=Paenibacillus sp. TaxID=58172 RepID=UPI002D3DF043|nr:hypothetical protein [Paenibacillus sp.]HZG56801.1 hypothetical protein [Paenibacillus sp.]
MNYPVPLSSVDSVVWDVYEAICQSVAYLARIGHRRILYIGDVRAQRGYVHRWQAFEEMRSALGKPPLRSEAAECVEAFRRHEPTAVQVGIDEDGLEVYRRLTE